jgi:hypothetical protein
MMTDRGLFRLTLVSVALIALTAINVAAQQPPAGAAPDSGPARPGTPQFGWLVSGRKVTVITTDGQKHKGSFTSSGMFTGPSAPVPSDRIVKVERVTNSFSKGLAIGLISGLGFGGFVYIFAESDVVWMAPLVGAGVGAGIGAAHRRHEVLYDAQRSSTKTRSIAPILSKTSKGAKFSMTWR